jgi:hypothetical protein
MYGATSIRAVIPVIVLALVVVVAAAAGGFGGVNDGLATAKGSTVKFRDLGLATQAGYGLLKDKRGIACIADSMPGMSMGAMGVHYAKSSLVGDGALDVHTPEALVYAPFGAGKGLRLAAVEYVALKAAWNKLHNGAPVMFGRRFNFTPAGNRFGLPAYYSLHVWLFKSNPSGEFSMWNPLVKCGGAK